MPESLDNRVCSVADEVKIKISTLRSLCMEVAASRAV